MIILRDVEYLNLITVVVKYIVTKEYLKHESNEFAMKKEV
jgi:hypothetical protein